MSNIFKAFADILSIQDREEAETGGGSLSERFIPQNVPAVQIYEDEFSLQKAEQPKAFILFTCKPKQSEGAVTPWAERDVEWRQMMKMMMCTVYGRVCEGSSTAGFTFLIITIRLCTICILFIFIFATVYKND